MATDVGYRRSPLCWPVSSSTTPNRGRRPGLARKNTITVSLRTASKYRVLIGKKKGADDTYIKMADEPSGAS